MYSSAQIDALLEDTGILPVINVSREEWAQPLAKALLAGGIPCLEVTLRSPAALSAIRRIKAADPDFAVGAGTVLSAGQAREALAAGADFIVSPGLYEELVKMSEREGFRYIPGCSTATELQTAVRLGLKIVKFFPAELSGGTDAITLLSGAFSGVRFLPTGGITFDNLSRYLQHKRVAACGGSFMAPAGLLREGRFEEITQACRRAVDLSLGFEPAHVGINCPDAARGTAAAETAARLFRLPVRDASASAFAGSGIECMKTMYYGEKGHIGFYTNSMRRALAYFQKQGIAVRPESVKRDENGEPVSAYLERQLEGFALHIVRRA